MGQVAGGWASAWGRPIQRRRPADPKRRPPSAAGGGLPRVPAAGADQLPGGGLCTETVLEMHTKSAFGGARACALFSYIQQLALDHNCLPPASWVAPRSRPVDVDEVAGSVLVVVRQEDIVQLHGGRTFAMVVELHVVLAQEARGTIERPADTSTRTKLPNVAIGDSPLQCLVSRACNETIDSFLFAFEIVKAVVDFTIFLRELAHINAVITQKKNHSCFRGTLH